MQLRPQAGTATLIATACLLVMQALASPMKREPEEYELQLTQTVPETVNDMENFHWKNTIKNTGDKPVVILLTPYSALYHDPLKIYNFEPSSGQKTPKYEGWMLKFIFSEYLEMMKAIVKDAVRGKKAKGSGGKHKDYVILKKDEEYSVTHQLETAWDFTHAGEDTYKAELKKVATYVWVYDGTTPTTAKKVKLAIAKSVHTVKITGKLKNEEKLLVNVMKKKRSKRDAPDDKFDSNCDDTMKAAINGALSHANDYVKDATNYVKGMDLKKKYVKDGKVQERFGYWFGDWNEHDAHKTVLEVFEDKLSKKDFEKDFSFDCEDFQEKRYAAAIPGDPDMTIYPAALFFESTRQNIGKDSRAGILIHEATHFDVIRGTDDYDDPDKPSEMCYDHDCCHRLALKEPEHAINSADNYEYLAENSPKRSED